MCGHAVSDPCALPLNDVVCAGTGEVRPEQLLIDVSELIWEPPAEH